MSVIDTVVSSDHNSDDVEAIVAAAVADCDRKWVNKMVDCLYFSRPSNEPSDIVNDFETFLRSLREQLYMAKSQLNQRDREWAEAVYAFRKCVTPASALLVTTPATLYDVVHSLQRITGTAGSNG